MIERDLPERLDGEQGTVDYVNGWNDCRAAMIVDAEGDGGAVDFVCPGYLAALSGAFHDLKGGELDFQAQKLNELHTLLASSPIYTHPTTLSGVVSDVEVDVPTFDLDAMAWEQIKKAAAESEWIPSEYMANDWHYDVCEYLRKGAPTYPPAQPTKLGDAVREVPDLVRYAIERCLLSQQNFADGVGEANPGDKYASLMVNEDIDTIRQWLGDPPIDGPASKR